MKLAYWMYAGPAHIGTLRVASSFKNVYGIMHAPLGDDYFNVMRSMFERERDFTPVTSSIVNRHVLARGSKNKVVDNIIKKDKHEKPDLILVTPTCTSSILQENLKNFVERATGITHADVLLADVNHYRINEFQAADKTLKQVIDFYLKNENIKHRKRSKEPSVNILGIFTLGFHHQHDCREIYRLLKDLGIKVNLVVPESCRVTDLNKITDAWLNIVPYREIGLMAAEYLKEKFFMPYVARSPMGLIEIDLWIREICGILRLKFDYKRYIYKQTYFISQAAWFSRSIDCQNLTGKSALVFGDTTHAAAITKILAREIGVNVCCAGTYCRYDANWFREQIHGFCDQILITEDYSQVGNKIAELEPSAIFGTQMERHIGKRLNIPCGVISAPIHIQNFPLGYRPFFGYEGTNQIADLIYNSFTLGMEDHLLEVFGGHDVQTVVTKDLSADFVWTSEAQIELQKIPNFVRNKVRKSTEKFARLNEISRINLEVMYKAKEALTN